MATRPRLPAVLTIATVTVVALEAAQLAVRAWSPSSGGRPVVATAAGVGFALVAGLWLRLPRGYELPRATVRWLGVLPVVAAAIALCLREFLAGVPVGYLVSAIACVASIAVATLLGRAPFVVGASIAFGLVLRAFELRTVPIDAKRADMLPLVLAALDSARSGVSPYRVYHFPWDVPLTYLPLGWLAYAPLHLAGIDLRWTNALAELSVLGAVLFAARKRVDPALRDAAMILWAAWFVSHRIVRYDGVTAAPVQWAAMTWVAALAVERSRWTSLAAGVALATTPLVAPLLPTLGLAWRRAWNRPASARPHRTTSRPLLRAAVVAAMIACALVGPWLLASPRAFFDGVFLWFNDLDRFPRAKWLDNRAWATFPSLAGVFWHLGVERLLKPIQVSVVVLLAVIFARRTSRDGPRALTVPFLVASFMAFLLLNPMIWEYLWEPAACLAFVAVASTHDIAPHVSAPRA